MWHRYASIITRDNMNYQAYDFYFDPKKAPKGSGSTDNDPWLSLKTPGSCIGQYCCSDGQTYDAELNKCVIATTTESFVTETMVNNVLTKTQNGKFKDDVNIGNIQAPLSNSFINK